MNRCAFLWKWTGNRVWVILTVGLFAGVYALPSVAQCPDTQQVYAQVNEAAKADNQQVAIRQLLALLKTTTTCPINNDSVQSKLVHVLGRTYWYSGDLGRGLAYTRQAIALNARPSPTAKAANLTHSYFNAGQILTEQMHYQQALKLFDSCIVVARHYPAKYGSGANAYAKKAYLFFLLGDYDQALRSAELGYHLAELADNTSVMIQNSIQQAQAQVGLQKPGQAQQTLLNALALAKKRGATNEIADIYTGLAEANIQLDLKPAVIQYYRLAYAVNKQDKYDQGCAQALTNLGYYYRSVLHDYVEAIRLFRQALPYVDDPFVQLRILDNIGDATRAQHHYAEALTYFQQAFYSGALHFNSQNVATNPTVSTLREMANKEYLLTLIQDKADTWLDYAKATNRRDYLQHALETYQLASQLIDVMRWEHTGTAAKLYWRQKTRGLYERAIETCYRLGNTEQAYQFFEKSRAVMLTDKLNELGAHQQLTPAQMAQENQLRQRVSQRQAQLATTPVDTKTYTDIRLKLAADQEQFDGFIKQLEQSNPAYYRYKYDSQTHSLPDLQQWLGQQAASLVSYFVGDSGLYVLGITPHRTQLRRQPVGQYQQTANEFRQLLSNAAALNQHFTRYQALSFALYQQLLAPLHLPDGRVMVSPDGFFLPLESLSQRPDGTDLLVNHYAISYTYSVRLLLKTRPPTNPDREFLGMAPVTFQAGLSPLPGSDDVLRQIGQQFSSTTLLTNAGATRRSFREQAPYCRIIQLFTHADASSDPHGEANTTEPVLYFADSTLRLSEISDQTPFLAELLVLSACKTGIGVNQQGEGVFSLARGFAAVGIPSILTTLWSVDNQATYRLTELVYKQLAAGKPKDIALQKAKQEFLATASRSEQLPTNWAGLILVGNADPLPTSPQWPSFMLGGVVLLAGLSGWLLRRERSKTHQE